MVDIALDLNPLSSTYRDLLIVNGDLVLITGISEIRQLILQTLSIFLGEWFMDNTIGIDYFGQILVQNPSQSKIDAIFINQILNIPGVNQLNSYSFSPNIINRQLKISFSAESVSGTVDYAGLIQS